MDFERAAKELIRSLRGRRSQAAFSRRLGYRSNVVHAWEAGRRWPAADETLRAAALVGVDLRAAFGRFFHALPDELTDAAFVARFLREQQGEASTSAVATRAGVNRFTVARWLSGAAVPRLPDFLRMVEATSLRAVDLLAGLAPPAGVPSVAATWARREAQRSLAIELPWAPAVLRRLEVAPDDDAAVATALGLPLAEVQACTGALQGAGLVRRIRGGWQPVVVDAVDTRRSPETARRLKAFWARVALERLEAGVDGAFAYNVVSVSQDQLRRLHELHDAYFQAIRGVVAEDAPPEVVALLNLQLLRLDVGSATSLEPHPTAAARNGA